MTLFLFLPAAFSCSIKEQRTACPCYLDVTLTGSAPGGNAWCTVWSSSGEKLCEQQFPLPPEPNSVECRVPSRERVRVIVSSLPPEGDHIRAENAAGMPSLYASYHEVDCTRDEADLEVDGMGKRFCRLTLRLAQPALDLGDRITVTVESPWSGISFPDLRPLEGTFRHSAKFDSGGRVTVSLPPQGGPGLTLRLRLESGTGSALDLYSIMREAGYEWDRTHLPDFSCEVSLNGVTHAFEVGDWQTVDLDGREF